MSEPKNSDDVWRREEIESPCVQLCMLHPQARICVGCHRTGEEIGAWSRLTPEARREIMEELPARASLLREADARPSRRRARGDRDRDRAHDQGDRG